MHWHMQLREVHSNDALPKRPYQELLEAFRLGHCISIDMRDGTKLQVGNGFTELIDYAITHHFSTLEFLSTTGRTTFVEDRIRKYEHVILRTIKNIEAHDFWDVRGWPGIRAWPRTGTCSATIC